GTHAIEFDSDRDIEWCGRERLAFHPNALTFTAHDEAGRILATQTYYSIGGGFVLSQDDARAVTKTDQSSAQVPHPFENARDLLDRCEAESLTIAELMLRNECALRPERE